MFFSLFSSIIYNSRKFCLFHFILRYLIPAFLFCFIQSYSDFLAFIIFVTKYAATFSPRLLSGALTRDQTLSINMESAIRRSLNVLVWEYAMSWSLQASSLSLFLDHHYPCDSVTLYPVYKNYIPEDGLQTEMNWASRQNHHHVYN